MQDHQLPEAGAILKASESDTTYWTPLEQMYDELHRARTKFLREMVERVKGSAANLEECTDQLLEPSLDLRSDVPKAWQRAEKALSQFIAELEGAAKRIGA